jgi:hypothetical protein
LFQFFLCLLFLRFINHGSYHTYNPALFVSNNMTQRTYIFCRPIGRYIPVVSFPNVCVILLNGSYLFFYFGAVIRVNVSQSSIQTFLFIRYFVAKLRFISLA